MYSILHVFVSGILANLFVDTSEGLCPPAEKPGTAPLMKFQTSVHFISSDTS